MRWSIYLLAGAAALWQPGTALTALNTSDFDAVKAAAASAARNAAAYYHGNQTGGTPGLLDASADWFQSAALLTSLLDYDANTGDNAYNILVARGLTAQKGPFNDFEPLGRPLYNNVQGYWALGAISAAEHGLSTLRPANANWVSIPRNVTNGTVAPNPPWHAVAANAHARLARRWDISTCGGGLRWAVNPRDSSYGTKPGIDAAVFFLLSARLYRFTYRQAYADWARVIYEWLAASPLLVKDGGHYIAWAFLDARTCTRAQANDRPTTIHAALVYGAAVLYNATGSAEWRGRAEQLASDFGHWYAPGGRAIEEPECARTPCTGNPTFYKGIATAWLAYAAQQAPSLQRTVQPIVAASAQGANQACDGRANKSCGQSWRGDGFDGHTGVGEDTSAMNALAALMARFAARLQSCTAVVAPASNVDIMGGDGDSVLALGPPGSERVASGAQIARCRLEAVAVGAPMGNVSASNFTSFGVDAAVPSSRPVPGNSQSAGHSVQVSVGSTVCALAMLCFVMGMSS